MKKEKKSKRTRKKQKNKEEQVPKAIKEMKSEKNKENFKSKNLDKKKKETKKAGFKKFIIIILIIIIISMIMALFNSAFKWRKLALDMTRNENSIVQDIDGNTIGKIGCERKNIKTEKIPKRLKDAYVSIEDERFYKHHGVDVKRTASAIASYIIHFGSSSFGGSSITQQLVKNYTGDSTDSIKRKVTEWWKALIIETSLSKDQILDAYLNVIYVGPNTYGVGAGAKYYFNKTVDDLTLEESAFLAGINHSPNSYNPFNGKDNSEKIKKRTKIVLTKMKELEYISKEEYDIATANLEQGLKFSKGEIPVEEGVYSYHTDALISEVTEDISKKFNISKNFATNYLNMAGATICSTQDSKIQQETEKEFNNKRYQLPSQDGKNHSHAAMVIMDYKKGAVVSCVGGLGKKDLARPFNRATQSVRQTGSAMKPLCILAPAIEEKIITASTIIDDTEQDFTTEFQNDYHPTDYNKALGKITVRRATESSQNIPFVKIMEILTPEKSIEYLEEMGITTLTEKDNNLPLSLGGLEKGISPLQMAGAYSMIANDGIYIEPTFYSKVIKSNGKTLVKSKQERKRVISKETAFIIKEMLTEPVLGNNGTATYCKIPGIDVSAKTGTTDENYDRWLCGFTPYYSAVTWYGFDQNESIHFNKQNPAGLIWANVMRNIHRNLPKKTYDKPKKVTSILICPETGEVATEACPNAYTEYFITSTVPNLCTKHKGIQKKNTLPEKSKENIKNIEVNTEIDSRIDYAPDSIDTPKEEIKKEEPIKKPTIDNNSNNGNNKEVVDKGTDKNKENSSNTDKNTNINNNTNSNNKNESNNNSNTENKKDEESNKDTSNDKIDNESDKEPDKEIQE